MFLHSSSVAYCIFEQSADVEKIIVVLQAICCTAICWFNPHGFRTAGMLVPVPGTADRPDICIHAPVCPPVGNFWRLPYLLIRHRSCRSASAEQSGTPRALRMQLSGCRMTAYRMTAPSAPLVLHTQSFQSSNQQPRWL